MLRLLVPLLLLVVAECRLDFDYSALYDMNDFKGTPNYPVRICEPGCRVYLTYPDDPLHLGDQDNGPFTIQIDGQPLITFYDLNRLNGDNGEKGYFLIPAGTSEFIVHNPNGNFAARPLALWVVQNTSATDGIEVYEATDGAHIESSNRGVVLMGVDPFTVDALVFSQSSLTVKTSPFDMMDREQCEYVFKYNIKESATFSLSFNSPVISFGFKSESDSFRFGLDIDHSFPDERSMNNSGYLASPGYIGCTNATFRSESYNYGVTSFNETFLVDGYKKEHISFYGDLDTDDTAPVLLYNMDTDSDPMIIIGKYADNSNKWRFEMDTSAFSVHFDSLHWKNESFMIRYEVDDSGTVHTTLPGKTTNLIPKTTTTQPIVAQDNYCKCGIVDGWFENDWDPAEIWVDVVIILDTSKSMGASLEEAKSVITSFVGLMSTDTNAEFYSRIGVIAVSDTVQVVYNLNMSNFDNLDNVEQHQIDKIDVGAAFQAALKMFADGTKVPSFRENAKQIIYYLTNSAPGANMNGVDDFKTGGGIIIVNDFILEGEVADPGLQKLASDNFFFTDLSEDYVNSLGVFCEANCFCTPAAHPYNDDDNSPRTQANLGCYHPVNNGIPQPKARETCNKEAGSLVSIHNKDKEFFVNGVVSIFGPKKKFWIGFENDGYQWNWDDNSTDPFTDWDVANGQPNTNGGKNLCAYAQQGTGFNTPWTAANCAMGGVIYVCESRPCSRGYKNCT